MLDLFYLKKIKRTPLIPKYDDVFLHIKGKLGLEIGGPSNIFKKNGPIPIYPYAKRIDGCNYSSKTVWQGKINAGRTYSYMKSRASGYQYISDGTELDKIETGSYDFLLASHCLEHISNPIKALKEWMRVINENGIILLILPDQRHTFDHKRDVASLEHLISDYDNNVGEDDLTHLDEILERHDLSMDLEAGDIDSFRKRSLKNFENRCLHQHVFDKELICNMVKYLKYDLSFTTFESPYHIISMIKK
jgi:predicted SAM-dependent methyltransferase